VSDGSPHTDHTIEPVEGEAIRPLADHLGAMLTDHAAPLGIVLKANDLGYAMRDSSGAMIGGVYGNTLGSYLYVARLWVSDTARNAGVGSQLMLTIEQTAASQRGVRTSFLNTFEFQARTFYEKLGYEVFATLEDPEPQLCRYFMKKAISPA